MSHGQANQKKTIIGIKQTVKALRTGRVQEVLLASDADGRLLGDLLVLARENGVPVRYAGTRLELGLAHGIDVGASVVAITE
ncbi:ribosomal L7Ae/L30e/S12e/Gadd45 family protein [Edaphobacillus lindanitolerans]|uniref:Large subunit ribosomal protein L7A n=1 Tax=Edaphobacillus lindanitolerans TaxID=550447 RepID=A0A1U7PRU1_9BACI|nr:ribosomal L7Ae/L30e/S12e/Gadd45 family protein [Edaphobacillus lindanitolerans]SIT87573.1 large subunit ribosomal protein L7A [Edaphobacillus lindanitolerans]